MKLTELTDPKVGDVIFSAKAGLLCKVVRLREVGFRFYVYNGDWYGSLVGEKMETEVKVWGNEWVESSDNPGDFMLVEEMDDDEKHQWYYHRYGGENWVSSL